jgi:hypothetical protein
MATNTNSFLTQLHEEATVEAPIVLKHVKIEKIVIEQYANPTHFIYELLQNASDANASKVAFTLEKTRLVFQHNGSRLFSEHDVRNILRIGFSEKEADETMIGKFGIGFKSVYRFTKTPIIYSGKHNFRIDNFIVPTEVARGEDYLPRFENETCFIIPFNSTKIHPEDSYLQIENGLASLDIRSLIFLKNLSSIEIDTSSHRQNLSRKFEESEIFCLYSGDQVHSRWLRWDGETDIHDASFELDGHEPTRRVPVSVAFEVVKAMDSADYQFVKVQKPVTAVTFDLSEYDSGLLFHINAPFSCSLSRETLIRDSIANQEITRGIAHLITSKIKENWLGIGVPDSFLSLLPVADFDPLMKPIAMELENLFKTSELLKSHSGSILPGNELTRVEKSLYRAINFADLEALIVGLGTTKNLDINFAVQTDDVNANRFLSKVAINQISKVDLKNILTRIKNEENRHQANSLGSKWNSWLDDLPFDDYFRFLVYLSSWEWSEKTILTEVPILRTVSNGCVIHSQPSDSFFPNERFQYIDHQLVPELWIKLQEENYLALLSFFQFLGVREYNEESQLLLELMEIEKTREVGDLADNVDKSKAQEDLSRYLKYALTNVEIKEKIQNGPFLLGYGRDRELLWVPASGSYVDLPFKPTGWADLFFSEHEISHRYLLWDGYKNVDDILKALISCGACATFYVIKPSIRLNREASRIDWNWNSKAVAHETDYYFQDLDIVLEHGSIQILSMLWEVMRKNIGKYASASYSKGRSYSSLESQLVQKLKSTAWVPGKDGNLYQPSHIKLSNLHNSLSTDDLDDMRLYLDLALVEENTERKLIKEKEAWTKLGINPEVGESLAKLSPEEQQECLSEYLRNHAEKEVSSSLLESDIRSDESSDRARKIAENDAQVQRRKASRQIRINEKQNQDSRRAQLRLWYENENFEIPCQSCGIVKMPFQRGTPKKDFFFAPIFIQAYEYESHENAVSLCPICYAKWRYTLDDAQAQLIVNQILSVEYQTPYRSSYSIEVYLAGKIHNFRFAQRHFDSLRHIARRIQGIENEPQGALFISDLDFDIENDF